MERQKEMLTGKQEEEEEKQKNQSKREVQPAKQHAPPNPPPSSSSSPSHEFSFTVSLHHPPSKTTPAAAAAADNKTKSPPPFALDLSPADEIFFHGHLLPLHLLSHLPVVSPRSSTNSLDSFTLPIKHLPLEINTDTADHDRQESRLLEAKARGKSKSFFLFGLPRWRKGYSDAREKEKRKPKFDISNVIKRYLRLVKPFLSLRNRNGNPPNHRQPPYSFSGNLQVRSKKELRGRREFSAPASMRTSPTNSGLLVASGNVTPTKSDSTMEELQAAIQAAIAHCKKSIATDDKIKPSL